MPGRTYSSGDSYRYGFNGMEKDDEPKGEGNQIDFGARIYEPRLGQWLSLDPLQKKYPGESHYAFVSGNPIVYADKDGRDKIVTITIISKDGTTTQIQVTDKNYFEYGKDGRYGGAGYYYWKQDVHQNIVLDFKNNKASISFSRAGKEFISGYEYSKLSDLVNGVFDFFSKKVGDNSDKFQYGYRIYGKGKSGEWQKGLPKPYPGADESIDLATILDLASGMREGESIADLAKKLGLKKTSDFYEKMEKINEGMDGIVDAMEGTEKMFSEAKQLIKKKVSPNEITVIENVDTIYTKNGYKYPSEGNGRGGTLGESKDSTNGSADTTYRNKTVYKLKQK